MAWQGGVHGVPRHGASGACAWAAAGGTGIDALQETLPDSQTAPLHCPALAQVAFIEMARSLLPLFTMLALFLAGLESPNAELVKAVCATAVGCALSAYGEVGRAHGVQGYLQVNP